MLDDLEDVGLPFSFWRTPLACLFGLVPDPLEMLAALLPPGRVGGQAGLPMHALLANPMPPDHLAETVRSFLQMLPPVDGVAVLRCLADQRPDLSPGLARRLLEGGVVEVEALVDRHGASLPNGTSRGK